MRIQSPNCQTAGPSSAETGKNLPCFGLARRSPSLIAALGLPLMLPFYSPNKKTPSTERAALVGLGEFICAALGLAGVVAVLWLVTKPEDPTAQPCLRGTCIYS